MSVNATRTIWQVTIEEGSFASLREGTWLFTNERAATAFARAAEASIAPRHLDVSVSQIEAYKTAIAALYQGYPFDELREAATRR